MRNLIIKWFVYKNKTKNGNGATFEARGIEINKEDYINKNIEFLTCWYTDTGIETVIERSFILDSEKEAKRTAKEKTITRKFKYKNRKSNGTWKCSCCGKVITEKWDATIDHIKPKKYFKNKKGEYYSDKSWQECWSEENLAIACERCNQNKGSYSLNTHKEIDKAKNEINKAKKRNKRNLGAKSNKIGYRIKNDDEYALEIARRDSRQWDINKFFKKKQKKN